MTRDTTASMQEQYRAMLMARSPAERLASSCRMFTTARELALAGLAGEIDSGGHSLRARLFLRFYGRDFDAAERLAIVEKLDRMRTELSPHETP